MRTARRPCGWSKQERRIRSIGAGINRKTVALGTVVIIDGFRSKDEALRANGRRMTLTNGETLFMGSSGNGRSKGRCRI